jgi:hypothetical protein
MTQPDTTPSATPTLPAAVRAIQINPRTPSWAQGA